MRGQARSLGLYAWRGSGEEMGTVGGYGWEREVDEEGLFFLSLYVCIPYAFPRQGALG